MTVSNIRRNIDKGKTSLLDVSSESSRRLAADVMKKRCGRNLKQRVGYKTRLGHMA